MLAKYGREVHLVGRREHVQAIRDRGLRITGLWGDHRIGRVQADTEPRPGTGFDLILITVRAFQTRDAVQACIPFSTPETVFVSAQNGYGNLETLAELVGEDRAVGARVLFGVETVGPGTVRLTVFGDSVRLGGLKNRVGNEILDGIADLFGKAGIPAERTDRIEHVLWEKILYNCCLNPLGAILDVPYGALAASEETRALMGRIVGEAFGVFRVLRPNLYWESPEDFLRTFYERMVPPTAAHRSSMLQDLKLGRQTEIESLNGAVVRLGREMGVDTPVNETVTRLIRFREAGFPDVV